jgi:N-acetylmuramic acid 6-phosphate etherase
VPPTNDAPTERANTRTEDLDRLSADALVGRLLDEDAGVATAVLAARREIVGACDVLTTALGAGGRWFNLGAGTSGRLGYLDAAEIPPTFGLAPERVQAVIAGGADALVGAVEGAEDDPHAAARELDARLFTSTDVLVAISASGSTPFVLGGIAHARARRARTIGITCAPGSPLAEAAEIAIVADVGAEAIAGSTRMKGGLAQKMILHTLSTAVMVRLGRVRGNRMVELVPLNRKLRERAIAMIVELAGCEAKAAERALDEAGGRISRALDLLRESS